MLLFLLLSSLLLCEDHHINNNNNKLLIFTIFRLGGVTLVVLCRARIGHTHLTHSYILKKDPPLSVSTFVYSENSPYFSGVQ